MSKINSTQAQLLNILRNRSNSYTLDELASLLSLSNKSSVHYNIRELIKKGFLKVNPANPSDYIVLDLQDNGMLYLPLYSGAKCGPDGKFISDLDTSEIPIPSRLFSFDTSHALAIRTEGNSMEPKIPEGAVVIVNKNENEYVANQPFLAIVNNMPLIKIVFDPGITIDHFILSSYNPEFAPFLAAKQDTILIGRVRGIIHSF